MKFRELIEVINKATTRGYQYIDLFNNNAFVCKMRGNSELVNIYGDYKVISVTAVGDEEFKINVKKEE